MSSLMSMTPQQATIAETGEVVNVKDVKLNTILAVKAGELVPIDGVVVEGTCEVDEKTLTGESFPVPKQKDSNVWAGTVNVNGNSPSISHSSSTLFTFYESFHAHVFLLKTYLFNLHRLC